MEPLHTQLHLSTLTYPRSLIHAHLSTLTYPRSLIHAHTHAHLSTLTHTHTCIHAYMHTDTHQHTSAPAHTKNKTKNKNKTLHNHPAPKRHCTLQELSVITTQHTTIPLPNDIVLYKNCPLLPHNQ